MVVVYSESTRIPKQTTGGEWLYGSRLSRNQPTEVRTVYLFGARVL